MMVAALLLSALLHPFHVSVAEAQWSSDGKRLKVALRLSPHDLDAVLSEKAGEPVRLEKQSDERAQELVETYLRDAIFLSSTRKDAETRDAQSVADRHDRFHWVGLEHELRYVWVYFELERPSSSEAAPDDSLYLTNRVMFETEASQINTVQLMRTDPPIAVRTSRVRATQSLPLPKN